MEEKEWARKMREEIGDAQIKANPMLGYLLGENKLDLKIVHISKKELTLNHKP